MLSQIKINKNRNSKIKIVGVEGFEPSSLGLEPSILAIILNTQFKKKYIFNSLRIIYIAFAPQEFYVNFTHRNSVCGVHYTHKVTLSFNSKHQSPYSQEYYQNIPPFVRSVHHSMIFILTLYISLLKCMPRKTGYSLLAYCHHTRQLYDQL